MASNFIASFIEDLKKAGFATAYTIRGCSLKKVNKLESFMNVTLPTVYRDFLLAMGQKAGEFNQGTDCFYDDLFNLRDDLEDILREDDSLSILRDDIFVFSGHQGCIFHFFYTLEDRDDPPVYGYLEGDRESKKINSSFSGFLSQSLKELKNMRECNQLLETFIKNRNKNPALAYKAGEEFTRKYSYIEGIAESINEWMADYKAKKLR